MKRKQRPTAARRESAPPPGARAPGEPPEGPPWDAPLDRACVAFVDLEMTGLDVRTDRVIEICIERRRGGALEDSLDSLVRPEDGRFGNEHIHGISVVDLERAPTFTEVAERVRGLLEGAVLVAHGATYDVAFLQAEFARVGASIALPHHLDTLTLSRRVFGFKSHALGALAQSLGIDVVQSHRASADVRTLRSIFERVVEQLKPQTLRDLWHVKVGKRIARPSIIEALREAQEAEQPVVVRYRPSGKPPVDLVLMVTAVQWELDPPQVLGYLLPGRGRRELRADRILSVSSA